MKFYSITLSWHGKCFFPASGEKKHFVVKARLRALVKKIPTAFFLCTSATSSVLAAETHMDWLGYRHDYRSEFIVDETRTRAASNRSPISVNGTRTNDRPSSQHLTRPKPIQIYGKQPNRPPARELLACETTSRQPLKTGWLSSGFGMRQDPFGPGMAFHNGIDIAADTGTEIPAPASAVIHRTYVDDSGGNWIELKHQDQTITRFGHLSRFVANLAPGDRVERGETIGYVGNSGRSTGPHLHYEILKNGSERIDPLSAALPLSLASCIAPRGSSVAGLHSFQSSTYGGF